MKYRLPKRPASVQEANATEMALKPPSEQDLDALKQLFPTPDKFPYPTPGQIERVFHSSGLWSRTSGNLGQFIMSDRKDCYKFLYETGIHKLEKAYMLLQEPDGVQKVWDYLVANPQTLGNSSVPQDFSTFTEEQIVSRSITNIGERLYLSSNPAWGYLRPYLLEKYRYLKKTMQNALRDTDRRHAITNVLPQRPTTSRTLGDAETPLGSVNAGYKIDVQPDPFTSANVEVLQLVTWVFTDALTKKLVFVDYFDIVNGDIDAAIAEMKKSDLYRAWARNLSPREYAQTAEPYQITENTEELLQGLTPIQKRITT